VRTSREYERILNYIEQNPVRAGLVDSPEQWPRSSAATGQAKACPTIHDKGFVHSQTQRFVP